MPALCTVDDLEAAYKAADTLHKSGPLTVAGRALTKHNPLSRPGSVFPAAAGDPAAINRLALETVAELLSDPGTVKVDRGRVYDLIAPDGRGLRFHADRTLKGFLEP